MRSPVTTIVALFCTIALLCVNCAQDNTAKKKTPTKRINDPQDQSPQDSNPNPNQPHNNQNTDDCGAANFSKNLSGTIEKNINALFAQTTIKAEGFLSVQSNTNDLTLNVSHKNLTVTPNTFINFVEPELNKVVGSRVFNKLSANELNTVAGTNSAWQVAKCRIGLAKLQTFPAAQGRRVTVEFSPALPFAPFPDKLDSTLQDAADNGLEFTAITGKIVSIEGGNLNGFNIGDTYSGSVTISRSGETYTTHFNFGDLEALEKLGLFNSAAYTYNQNELISVKVQVQVRVPILNVTDTVEIDFN